MLSPVTLWAWINGEQRSHWRHAACALLSWGSLLCLTEASGGALAE
jgi:hypothetical protein